MRTRAEIGPLFKRAWRGVEVDHATTCSWAPLISAFSLSHTDDLIPIYHHHASLLFSISCRKPCKAKVIALLFVVHWLAFLFVSQL